jgi:hypothetical protein
MNPLNRMGWVDDDTAEDRFVAVSEMPLGWGQAASQHLADARRWVESRAIHDYPLTTLAVALGLGVLTGWLIKRR